MDQFASHLKSLQSISKQENGTKEIMKTRTMNFKSFREQMRDRVIGLLKWWYSIETNVIFSLSELTSITSQIDCHAPLPPISIKPIASRLRIPNRGVLMDVSVKNQRLVS